MRFSSDGYLDLRDPRYVRTPGDHQEAVEPARLDEAVAFLLSHSFPGHRRVVRGLSAAERRKIRLALWAGSVGERMALVDRVWRTVTEPVSPPRISNRPQLVQLVTCGQRGYPIYLDGSVTRVLPHGGVPTGEAETLEISRMDLGS